MIQFIVIAGLIWLVLALVFVLAIAAAAKRPMAEPIATHVEVIVCPTCSSHQEAVVEHTYPWWSYVHWCGECGACIGESEWQLVSSPDKPTTQTV